MSFITKRVKIQINHLLTPTTRKTTGTTITLYLVTQYMTNASKISSDTFHETSKTSHLDYWTDQCI